MRRRGAFWAALLLLTIGGLALRLPVLGNRPMHGDEAVHAFKFRELWKEGVYRYDPNEFHGPTLYYATLPSIRLHGRRDFADTQEADYRLPIAVFGAALVLLLALPADGLGRRATLWAGLLIALSPAFVFYSRYYIQETLLAFFTLGMLGCGWRYARSRRPGWLLAAGVCAGLMVASKETAVLAFGASAVALGLTAVWTRRVDGRALPLRPLWNGRLAAFALFAGLLTACLFLSGFLSNPSGPLDYLRSYTPWLHRAQGTDLHRHPWHYYLRLLVWTHEKQGPVWSEGLIVGLAVVGTVAVLLPQKRVVRSSPGRQEDNKIDVAHCMATALNGSDLCLRPPELGVGVGVGAIFTAVRPEGSVAFARFVAFYTLTLTAVYSLIPYKTPWCVLSFLNGMILLAGIGAVFLADLAPGRGWKAGVCLLLLAGCAQLGWQAYRTSYLSYTDPRNPYVYAQPVPDIENLGRRMEALSRAYPQHDAMVIKVFSTDTYYWPLPWYLRRFPNVGYWTQVPQDADAPVVLASPEFDAELTQKLDATHLMNGYFGLRSGVFFEIWIRMDLWKAYLETRKGAKAAEPGP
jgi:uncharacterized protein (TIGR03663 family)